MIKTKQILQSYIDQLEEDGSTSLSQTLQDFASSYDDNLREDPVSAIESAYALIQATSTKKSFQTVETPLLSSFFPKLVSLYFDLLHADETPHTLSCCAEMIDFVSDLLSQLSTRRFFSVFVKDCQFVPRTRCSPLHAHPSIESSLNRLVYYLRFEMDPVSGTMYSREELDRFYYKKMLVLQNILFKYYRDSLEELCMSSIHQLASRQYLLDHLNPLSVEELHQLAYRLRLVPDTLEYSKELLIEIFISEYEEIQNPVHTLNETPLLPDEHALWKDSPASLPKCNLQFLNLEDYLLRLHELYKEESFSQIQADLVSTLQACQIRLDLNSQLSFKGFSKMAVFVHSFVITQVRKSTVRDDRPAEVTADVVFSMHGLKGDCRKAWESLREHDIVFLLRVDPQNRDYAEYSYGKEKEGKVDEVRDLHSFLQKEGVLSIRCCEVVRMEDEEGVVLNNYYQPDDHTKRSGKRRKLVVQFDPLQYQHDMENVSKGLMQDPYEGFNVLIRRDPASNNFKAVLDTSLSMINTNMLSASLPSWLQDILVGRGNPSKCTYKVLQDSVYSNDFGDTLQDATHVIESFPDYTVSFCDKKGNPLSPEEARPPYRLHFNEDEMTIQCMAAPANHDLSFTPSELQEEKEMSNARSIRFTPTQVEAIHSCLNQGVSLIVGPPGTGKTDVAVQVINTLYNNNKDEHILLLTHGNHALNDIFEKIATCPIEKRHLLRLGQGERDLATPDVYNRLGRIDYCLKRREVLLNCVKRLAGSLGLVEDHAYSCETAEHFYHSTILPRMEWMKKVLKGVASEAEKEELKTMPASLSKENEALWKQWNEVNGFAEAVYFPFKVFFMDQAQPIFSESLSFTEVEERVELCFASLRTLFSELKEYRAFELLRTNYHRVQYILTNQARIIAMTCTHAAIARQRLLEADFGYDTLVIEEAGQIVELETFIPFVLQKASEMTGCRLKRVILLGDPAQLPPIVQNQQLARQAGYDQSLFARLLRLGVPSIQLDAQGRCRSSLASLFAWRYQGLSNLPHVQEMTRANACLRYEYQCIHCEGEEKQIRPHVYQNPVEANYIVSFYQYLRLCGYSAEQITVLTTYNGQRELIMELMNEHCKKNPVFGMPAKVTTVDKYQGQQNEIVLLSLVRSESVGYMRDVRRMIVAVSRARLGLYVFCNTELFANCFELREIFDLLLKRPKTLQLVENEYVPCERKVEDVVPGFEVVDGNHMMQIVYHTYEERRKMMEVEDE